MEKQGKTMAQGISKFRETFPCGQVSRSRKTMGAKRSEEEPVGSSRANALAKNSVNDQVRKTNQRCLKEVQQQQAGQQQQEATGATTAAVREVWERLERLDWNSGI